MKDHVLLVTGGAGHIGSSICSRAALKGCNIVILDKNLEGAQQLVGTLEQEYAVKALALGHDIMQPDAFAKVADDVEAAFGRLDYLVNNAAFYDDVPGWGVPFEEEGYEAWLSVMRVNLLAPFFLVQALHPLLKCSPDASVINISSIYGVVGPSPDLYEGTQMTNPAAYAASKGGVQQMGKWLSTMLAPEVRVNTVTPGGVARGQDEQFVARYNRKTPLGRMATEADISGAVMMLLSSDSGYITGQNLIVDGGWTAW